MIYLFDPNEQKIVVTVGGHEFEVVRARLGKYLLLEQLRKDVQVARYLSVCGVIETFPGLEALEAYASLINLNRPTTPLPLFKVKEEPKEDVPWAFEGHWMISWIHLVANSYHWALNDILAMNIDEFLAFVQEILVDEQLRKEWNYSLSELAYPYDPGTKTSSYKPLQRPLWMTPPKKQYQKMKIPNWLMPQGLIIDYSTLSSA